jgi:hypothetical protein
VTRIDGSITMRLDWFAVCGHLLAQPGRLAIIDSPLSFAATYLVARRNKEPSYLAEHDVPGPDLPSIHQKPEWRKHSPVVTSFRCQYFLFSCASF